MYGPPEGWTPLHIVTCAGVLLVPVWATTGSQLWKYSVALKAASIVGPSDIESLVERVELA